MNNDPRQFGGQEYAPPYATEREYGARAPTPDQPVPQPVMRPVPQGAASHLAPAGIDPHQLAAAISAPPPAPPAVVHTAVHQAPVVASVVPADVPTASVVPDPNLVILSKPYLAYGQPVDRITIRKPVTRDIKQCGNPVRMSTDEKGEIQEVDLKWDVVAKYISLLSSPPLPPPTVDEFDYFDLDACGAVIARFFVKLAP